MTTIHSARGLLERCQWRSKNRPLGRGKTRPVCGLRLLRLLEHTPPNSTIARDHPVPSDRIPSIPGHRFRGHSESSASSRTQICRVSRRSSDAEFFRNVVYDEDENEEIESIERPAEIACQDRAALAWRERAQQVKHVSSSPGAIIPPSRGGSRWPRAIRFASVTTAEPAIAVARDQVIDCVADHPGDKVK